MSTHKTLKHRRELHGIDVSPDLIAAAIGAVLEEVTAWHLCSFDPAYSLAFFDAIWVKIRDEI